MIENVQSAIGLIAIPLFAWLLSEGRSRLEPGRLGQIVAVGLGLQLVLAAVFLWLPQSVYVFQLIGSGVEALQAATLEGVKVVFGYLGGGPAPFEVKNPQNGFILAIQALPLILLISVLSKLLFHWGIMQRIVAVFALVLRRTMGVGGPLGTVAAANIFVGMVEAPLLVRPYLAQMSRSALFAAKTVGMATVAGTVMALYALILSPTVPGAAGHILAASIISAPAALMLAWIMIPEEEETEGESVELPREEGSSIMSAIATGTLDGLKLLAYVAAMLIVMLALVALANQILGLLTPLLGFSLTVQGILGWLLQPVAWLIGIPWGEAAKAAELIGIKTVLNEFVAYLELGKVPEGDLSARSRLIMTYALCGFANFGSLGILTGGLMAMVPERREDILSLGPKTLISGTLATLMTGAIVGLLTVS